MREIACFTGNVNTFPDSIERIAQKAEIGAAEIARSFVTLGYELLSDLVEVVSTSAKTNSKPPATGTSGAGQFLSVEEAAEFLRVKPSTIYSWVSSNKIPHSKVGSRVLFDRSELVEFAKRSDEQQQAP